MYNLKTCKIEYFLFYFSKPLLTIIRRTDSVLFDKQNHITENSNNIGAKCLPFA